MGRTVATIRFLHATFFGTHPALALSAGVHAGTDRYVHAVPVCLTLLCCAPVTRGLGTQAALIRQAPSARCSMQTLLAQVWSGP